MAPAIAAGENAAVMFGRERYGLEGAEVALANHIITFPVNPAFASLNLGQAVLLVAYEWFKLVGSGLPFEMPQRSLPAPKQQLQAFFDTLEGELEKVEFFRPPDKRATMQINLRNIFQRMQPTQQDIQTLHGVIGAIAAGRKGPARGGILDGDEASMLRALLSEHGQGTAPGGMTPQRRLARLLRRNPTDAERKLWDALTKDRRFAVYGFKRQVPIGPHIPDIVSFPLRLTIELVPAEVNADAAKARASRRTWLTERDYRVVNVAVADVEADVNKVLEDLSATLSDRVASKP
jgi:tRNA/rRNA methyltransferase